MTTYLKLAAVFFIVNPLLLMSCSGLQFKSKNGTVHHLIIGVGVVSTPANNGDGVTVVNSTALGINLSNQPGLTLGLGYSSSAVVSIPERAQNTVVEVKQSPFGDLSVTSPSQEGNENEKRDDIVTQ